MIRPWRIIGDGTSVKIMEDTWVPTLPLEKPSYIAPNMLAYGTVVELIDHDERCWKEDLLNSLFHPNEVEAILDIRLSSSRVEDKLIWAASKMGMFTVKSAYHVAKIFLEHEVDEVELRNPLWKLLWTAKILPKFNRNLCLLEGKCMLSTVLVRKVELLVKEYEEGLQNIYGEKMLPRSRVSSCWKPPRQGVLKLNCDAAFNQHSGITTLRVVLRDVAGSIVLGGVSKIEDVDSVLHAECLAILFGLEVAWEHGYTSLLVESYSKQAIEEIRKGNNSLWMSASIIHDVLHLSAQFEFISFDHVNREVNGREELKVTEIRKKNKGGRDGVQKEGDDEKDDKEGGGERLGTPSEGATPKMHSRQQSRHESCQRRPLRWPAHPVRQTGLYVFSSFAIIVYLIKSINFWNLADADMEDYGFEYSDEEPEEQDVDIENQYYNSKGLVETDPEGALAGFAEVVSMEPEKAEWGFKALKQTVKLYYRLGSYKKMMDAYREMLTYIKSAVTRNYSEKCINNIMDFVSGSASQNFGLLQEFYQTTLKALEEAKNERLWFKTNLKLCKIWFDMGEYGRMNKILKELHKSCQREDGTDDQKKGSQLLEVYAIEIQMYTETKNNKKLKQLYQKALAIKSAIPHPRIMGIIRECGGKMHMAERQWAEAATDFFEAFKNYDEAGNQRRIQCLKYLVLANMLMESEVNPFDGQEAKPYKNDPEILAMTNLIAAYQRNEIIEFEKILKSNRRTIMDDPFIRNYIEDLLKNVRTQVLLKLIKPYTRIRIPFISKELNVPEKDVEQLLVSLILDNRIDGHIDQVNRLLERGDRSKGMKKYTAIDKWNTQLRSLYQTVSNRVY
ncbi:hypothetical protein CCACVL1_28692 [Corchorus capsularis]|uniref:COP9 signalosome complex subunit 2 n=2 Tax=Magnoliopsida TaxID=3398 RepID=A0A1R3G5P8_COCAP|nr:hypothetical protein CCACVL1_28692 [Corchorus capsularis]